MKRYEVGVFSAAVPMIAVQTVRGFTPTQNLLFGSHATSNGDTKHAWSYMCDDTMLDLDLPVFQRGYYV